MHTYPRNQVSFTSLYGRLFTGLMANQSAYSDCAFWLGPIQHKLTPSYTGTYLLVLFLFLFLFFKYDADSVMEEKENRCGFFYLFNRHIPPSSIKNSMRLQEFFLVPSPKSVRHSPLRPYHAPSSIRNLPMLAKPATPTAGLLARVTPPHP